MTTDQITLFVLLVAVFALLIWGRWRYDVIAFSALVAALLLGVVPTDDAFSGFGHPATVIIALVLIVSRGLSNSGAIELLARLVIRGSQSLNRHIGLMAGLAAGLSAVMNNVAALALLMPIDLQAAAKAKRSPALTLMPLSFASILGGLITLIGTPPNIIIAAFRGEALGEPYRMFDFAPVGIACALIGVGFVALFGWRLIPSSRGEHDTMQELFELRDYIAELKVPENSSSIGQQVNDLRGIAADNEAAILGLSRFGQRLLGRARRVPIAAGDVLVVEANPANIDKLVGALQLEYVRSNNDAEEPEDKDLGMVEVVIPEGALIENRSAYSLGLLNNHDVTLLGVSRQGRRIREQVRQLRLRAGDILLLLGPNQRLPDVVNWLGCLPLAERGLQLVQRDKAWLAVAIFAIAVLLASFGLLYLAVALACVAVLFVGLNIVPLRQLYTSIEWPVIVLLGSMIPIGQALEVSGGTALIANGIVDLAAGYSPTIVLILLMVVTMTLSDVLNNTATAVIAAPIAIDIANRLNVSADPFLMAVAVAASCAFLTPIGHKNNTLIMGPGGYRFGDYWRMGLPLEIIVIVVAIPVILIVWPF